MVLGPNLGVTVLQRGRLSGEGVSWHLSICNHMSFVEQLSRLLSVVLFRACVGVFVSTLATCSIVLQEMAREYQGISIPGLTLVMFNEALIQDRGKVKLNLRVLDGDSVGEFILGLVFRYVIISTDSLASHGAATEVHLRNSPLKQKAL
ncbi:hypothetical protein FGIG_01979 [Fasciola gigantica]|uniref:Uncharacterized protein n=1 Tax=Fasciola gigantica TaxID=46835 RepID=A0A504YN35_FASGI|nr:hypothetical protein FGIG_01979 [Fasciola gigantica]